MAAFEKTHLRFAKMGHPVRTLSVRFIWRCSGCGFSWQQGVDEQEDAAADDGRVSDVEVGPVIAPMAEAQIDFDEIGDHAETKAVPYIAKRSAEDESESDVGQGKTATFFQKQAEDDHHDEERESGQHPACAAGGGGVGEEAEGGSGIEDVRDAQIARDDGKGVAFRDVMRGPYFGPAVEGDDECGDGQEPAATVLLVVVQISFLVVEGPGGCPFLF